MITLIAVFAIVTATMVVIRQLNAMTHDAVEEEGLANSWEKAVGNTHDLIGRTLLSAARPLTKVPSLLEIYNAPILRNLSKKLLSANLFGGDVKVFMAVQTVAAYTAAAGLLVAFTVESSLLRVVLTLVSAAVAAWPYATLSAKVKEREKLVNGALPHFADMLLIPISSGQNTLKALQFTAEGFDGPVADEVKRLVDAVRNNVGTTQEAYLAAGDRLGTQEAKQFMRILEAADTRGHKVAESIRKQAESLRTAAYQRRRAEMKRIPTKLVVTFAAHILPFIMILTLMPAFFAMSGAL